MCSKNYKNYSEHAICHFWLLGIAAVIIVLSSLLKIVLVFLTPFNVDKQSDLDPTDYLKVV